MLRECELDTALVFTEQYNRRAARFLKRHPDLRQQHHEALRAGA
jgi:hypothetical protein